MGDEVRPYLPGRIRKTGDYCKIHYPSGAETMMEEPASRALYEAYRAWRGVMGFEGRVEPPSRSPELSALGSALRRHGIALFFGANCLLVPDQVRYLHALLGKLPAAFLGRDALSGLVLGSERVDLRGASMGSAFREGTVHLYEGTLRGSRRYLLGMFLHELGHSTRHSAGLRDDFQTVRGDGTDAGNRVYALDWERGYAARLERTSESFEEFIAEHHLIYVADGPGLRRHIAGIGESGPREAYLRIYGEFRDRIFDGVEYGLGGTPCRARGE